MPLYKQDASSDLPTQAAHVGESLLYFCIFSANMSQLSLLQENYTDLSKNIWSRHMTRLQI